MNRLSDDQLRSIGHTMVIAAGCLTACVGNADGPDQAEAIKQMARSLLWQATVIHVELGEPCLDMEGDLLI